MAAAPLSRALARLPGEGPSSTPEERRPSWRKYKCQGVRLLFEMDWAVGCYCFQLPLFPLEYKLMLLSHDNRMLMP